MLIDITYWDADGEDVEAELPGKMVVCPRCEGHSTHLTPSIGEHAYTAEEFYESFSEPEDREEYFRRGGIYDVKCERCGGLRVVPEVDEDACVTEEQKTHLRAYHRHLRDEANYRRECEAERRFGC